MNYWQKTFEVLGCGPSIYHASAHMTAGYEKAIGVKMTPLVCQVVDGAN
ncbi:MAG: hypothetical protein M9920_04090 [Verrucomicrobiae bacterium]|nr:hypothetical protein [Verrucomicrobiae bacterium]